MSCEIKTPKAGEDEMLLLRNGKFFIGKLKSSRYAFSKAIFTNLKSLIKSGVSSICKMVCSFLPMSSFD